MLTVRRLKSIVRPILGIFNEDGALVQEVPERPALLYGDQSAQLDDLLYSLELELMDRLNAADYPARMANAKRTVSPEVKDGKEEHQSNRKGLHASHSIRGAGGSGGSQGST